ncbi:unnamed protein product, partial [Mesorhabditis belari]|uniref:Amino acid transporter transmembrane domain-containing protein n=1 Tax=Mesorhabditis belari TaxID=2138241 RepID=A0AAF3ERD4_9BILA
MFTSMKVVTFFALISSIFFAIGMIVILQFTIRQPTQWDKLPAYTDFTGTTMMIGILICGVLPTTMLTCGSIMTGLGFFGYTGFGDKIAPSITSNVPKDGLYSSVNVSLMIQTVLVHSFALFVIIEVFYPGFQRRVHERYPKTPNILLDKGYRLFWVLLTYFLAIGIPNLEIMIPLVGVTSGTLCALVYPPLFEILTFWHEWQRSMGYCQRISKVLWNCFCVCIGICAICAGVYSNVLAIIEAFHPGKTQLSA